MRLSSLGYPMIKSTLGQSVLFAYRKMRLSVLAAGMFGTVVLAQSVIAADAQDYKVTVKAGETFSNIVVRELNTLSPWEVVAEYNNLASPDELKPGDVIVIPAHLIRLKNFATVVYVKRNVTHYNSITNSKSELRKGDRIHRGDQIETDETGFVSVSFNGGTSVNIQPVSKMKVAALECVDSDDTCEIDLETFKGTLGVNVQSVGFKNPTEFNIKTPYASAAVRGTEFDFDVTDDGNILGVTEGTVEIAYNGASNNINESQGVLAGEGRSINDVFDLLKQPELALHDDVTLISSEDIISWQPVAQAASYRIDFASSESMADVLTSSSETNTFIRPVLPQGEIYVAARAVANNGLRGLISQKKLSSVAIDTESESPILDIELSGNEMQITASDGASNDIEIKIGNSLQSISNSEFIVADQVHRIDAGETLKLEIDRTKEWYLQGRSVINESTVSPYGLLYVFEETGG